MVESRLSLFESGSSRYDGFPLVVRCTYNGQGFLFPLNSDSRYCTLVDEVSRRFGFRKNDVITLHYSLPGCSVCYLHNEADFEMLFTGAKVYSLKSVDICVYKDNGTSSSVSHGGSVDEVCTCMVDEEDEYLGSPFRSEVSKPFLSDEWSSYISCVNQKFNGGIAEFKDKLKKYAVAVGFNFSFQRNDGVCVHVICKNSSNLLDAEEPCCWYVKGSVAACTSAFFIHSMNNDHTRKNDVITLHYSLPGCSVCYLHNEADFEMLFTGAKVYSLKSVDICVYKDNGTSSSVSHGGSVDEVCTCMVDEEDEYLGSPFRSEVSKPFLSDEWSSYISCVNQKFNGGIAEFKDKLKKYAVAVGFNFSFQRNDGVCVHVICKNSSNLLDAEEPCCWYVKGSVAACTSAFFIHSMNNDHTCSGVLRRQKHDLLDSDIVMTCIETDIMYNMTMRPKEVLSKFKSSYGFDITYKVALRAIQKAKNKLYGSEAGSFNKLSWYKDAIIKSNPGSVFELEVDPLTNRFKRLFLAYGGCVEGFRFCLPVLYIDGTFGKSVYKGQILAATGRNGNKGMFPLAICVCDSETEDNWYFFFSNLRKLLEPQERVITFISDRGIGLLSAFDNVFPGQPHLFCFKHLLFNLSRRYTGKSNSVAIEKIKTLFFKVAYSSTENEYRYNLRLLRNEGGPAVIDSFLYELPVENWCRAFYKGCRYGIMANGIAESFNNWIVVERLMPVYILLDHMRLKQMEMIAERKVETERWTSKLTPEMEATLLREMDKGRRFSVHFSSAGVYEVRSEYSYSVNLNERTCSCVKWQINCFPCPHALAAIQKSNGSSVYDYIDYYFHTSTFRQCYSFPIHPVSNVDLHASEFTSDYIYPPIAKRPVGRRKRKRIMSAGECVKKQIICGRCRKKGNHNRLTCTEVIQ